MIGILTPADCFIFFRLKFKRKASNVKSEPFNNYVSRPQNHAPTLAGKELFAHDQRQQTVMIEVNGYNHYVNVL